MILLQMGLSTIIIAIIILSVHPSFRNLKPIFKDLNEENKRYGFQLYLGSLFMVTTGYIAGMTLSFFNSDNVQVGFYTLSTTVTAPLALLPSIIGTTYFKQFAGESKIPPRLMKASLLITILTCFVFILIIRWLIVFFYTERYAPVGIYASVLAIGTSIHGFGDMINRFLGSHGQGKQIRNASIANGAFMVFGNCVLVYFFNIWGAIATTITCDLIYASLIMYYYKSFVKNAEV
jgi:O-antigen/teichoic acid export membrane protein